MLIAIDIGNSSINIGFFTASALFVKRIDTYPVRSSFDYSLLLDRFTKEKNIDKIPEGSIISSVVPGHAQVWRETLRRLAAVEPLLVSSGIKTGLTFSIPQPEKLGPDRIANAVAAHELFGCPSASVDLGTATTISVTGKHANYIGGAIIPGIRLMNESLAYGTSGLSAVPLTLPESALGRDTAGCIRSGLFYGTAGATEKIISEMETEVGFKFKIVLTGGYGGMAAHFFRRRHVFRPYLTLEGLRSIYKKNTDA